MSVKAIFNYQSRQQWKVLGQENKKIVVFVLRLLLEQADRYIADMTDSKFLKSATATPLAG
jgi:hypothetical protein